MHNSLAVASAQHSLDMVTNDFIGHYGTDGSSWVERAFRSGFPSGGFVTENTASGQSTVQRAHDRLMESSSHCRNIMNTRVTHIGVACSIGKAYGSYPFWTIMFGEIR